MARCTPSLLVVALELSACSIEPRGTTAAPDEWLFVDDTLGVAFEVPARWRSHWDGHAVVFAGEVQEPTFFTTLSLQAEPDRRQPLADALRDMVEPLLNQRRFALWSETPCIVASRPALAYRVELELHESPRWRVGVIFPTSGFLVDLAYAATPELFPVGVTAFEHALASFSVSPPSPTPAPLAGTEDGVAPDPALQ